MEKIRRFTENVDIKNKRVLLRSDFNVPLIKDAIQDKTRIDLSIPFIQGLLKKEAKILLISHLGRPKNEKDTNLSLKPIFKYLQEKIENKIHFYSDKITNDTKERISFLNSSEIIFFENIRFNEGEIKNDENFAKNLSSIADIYINDAFSCSHRMQASVHKIAKFVKNSYAGPMLMKEISAIDMVMSNKKNPTTCIIGGSKVSTKLGVIISLIKKVDNLIIVGAMANNFVKFEGNNVGKSLIENDSDKMIKEVFDKAKKNNCEVITPLDFVVSETMNGDAKFKDHDKIADNEIILDIGSKTIEKICNIIDISKTVLWNGPAGFFENKNFSKGTISIAEKISINTKSRSLISIVGGGDTVSAVKNNDISINFTHLSTAGGAFLEYIEGKNLPGVEVLK